jgi:hypothetical protein
MGSLLLGAKDLDSVWDLFGFGIWVRCCQGLGPPFRMASRPGAVCNMSLVATTASSHWLKNFSSLPLTFIGVACAGISVSNSRTDSTALHNGLAVALRLREDAWPHS